MEIMITILMPQISQQSEFIPIRRHFTLQLHPPPDPPLMVLMHIYFIMSCRQSFLSQILCPLTNFVYWEIIHFVKIILFG